MEPQKPPAPETSDTPAHAPREPGAVDAARAGAPAPFERLDRRVIPYWLLTGVIGVGVLATLASAAIALFGDKLPFGSQPAWIGAGIALLLLLLWSLIAPPLGWARWRFSIDEELLLARYGIVFHEEKAIPMSRLQHVDLTRGPIERAFGLATLVVFTAGTEGASFRLPGLAAARAQELRDRILSARGDDVV